MSLLQELKVPVIGLVENMKTNTAKNIQQQTEKLDIAFLGEIPYDLKIEEAIGDATKLLNSGLAPRVAEMVNGKLSVDRD